MTHPVKLNLSEDGSKLLAIHTKETVISKDEVIKLLNLDYASEIQSVIVDVLNNPNLTFKNEEGKELLSVITKLKNLIDKK